MHGCQATSARAMYSREWEKRHEGTKPDADHWHPTDGAMVWVSPDLEPAEEFLLPSGPPPPSDASDQQPDS